MLRVTTQEKSESISFRLDGKLAGPWVDEFAECWRAATKFSGGTHIVVDLTEVTYISAEGKRLLARMCQQGAQLRAAGCMMECIVEEIKRGLESSLNRPAVRADSESSRKG